MTTSDKAAIHMPKPKGTRLATTTIERCWHGSKEAMVEMHLVDISTRRIENVGPVGPEERLNFDGVQPG